MGTLIVVVVSPSIDYLSGFLQAAEPVLIQTFLSELPVQAFHEPVLGGLARLDKSEFDAGFLLPEKHRFTGELRAMISGDGQERYGDQ